MLFSYLHMFYVSVIKEKHKCMYMYKHDQSKRSTLQIGTEGIKYEL